MAGSRSTPFINFAFWNGGQIRKGLRRHACAMYNTWD